MFWEGLHKTFTDPEFKTIMITKHHLFQGLENLKVVNHLPTNLESIWNEFNRAYVKIKAKVTL